ncbi:polyamine transporter tpo5 [Vermiconidia calcicola]|uniref:Polyamine transporter tpo5 n=1 Tax=Vermiconidia calcicola TaxID=1690605 RepID=A0ACC3N8K2_9PEZI|nr:polyamine transporter tpo5 [Vermiconidia calcicola]
MSSQLSPDQIRHRKGSAVSVDVSGPHVRARRFAVADLTEADRALAADFGYKPVFKREFGYFAAFSFAVSISGTFSTIATTLVYPLEAGGSASACSVAELVSAYPTCGGLYYTVSRLAPREWVPSISWVTGWLNLLGQVAGVASSEWGASPFLLAAIAIGTDFQYQPTTGQTVGVMAGLTVITGLVNSLSTYWMENITKWYVVFHTLVIVTCSIALLAMAQQDNGTGKHTARYVFTDTHNVSGWTPQGWSFLFGFLSVSWTMTDYDATAHITEEIREPELKAPWAISLAMLFAYVVGWLFTIVLCFCMGDVDSILGSRIVRPVAQIFFNFLGKTGGMVFTISAFAIIKFVTFAAMQALGRTAFAFSRDRLVPFSNVWTKILPLTGTPILAPWISVFFCIAINFIGLGSYTAILGVFNVCAIALDWSYCIPIFCKLMFGKFEPGPWHMGRLSIFVNSWACIWTVFVTMNYAIVYLAGFLFFSTVYWFVRGKRFYIGPLIEAEVHVDSDAASNEDGTEHKKKVDQEVRYVLSR